VALRLAAALALLVLAAPAGAQDNVRYLMARVRFTTDPLLPAGCIFIATVADDSVKDLRRKIVAFGGNTAVIAFPPEDIDRIHAQAYRCPPPPALPPGVPPPPAGPPPPPPPGAEPPPAPPR
jgi:hypothetical protein